MLQVVRQSTQSHGVSKKTETIILSSWRESTTKQYNVYIRRWMDFCREQQINYMCAAPGQVLEFFTSMFDNIGYSALNTARASLASFVTLTDGYTITNHPLIIRYFKGAFNLKPPLPRYSRTWDVKVVLNYLRKSSPAKKNLA